MEGFAFSLELILFVFCDGVKFWKWKACRCEWENIPPDRNMLKAPSHYVIREPKICVYQHYFCKGVVFGVTTVEARQTEMICM